MVGGMYVASDSGTNVILVVYATTRFPHPSPLFTKPLALVVYVLWIRRLKGQAIVTYDAR